ncbi:MAG: right-handed parallel beta-helix repeat-containing protein [Euryarchaeota archaeon]|nr:right-handed parallel beta-helix repeat-containing protein [Euryarchaeota archaeon]
MRTPFGRLLADHTLALLAVGLLVCGLLAGGLFVADVDASVPDPVPFEDTRSVGFASEVSLGIDDDSQIPRAQVFYSQYQYVIGYYGVETAAAAFDEPTRQQQFGYPVVTYVTAYDDTGLTLDANGTIHTDDRSTWVSADEAAFVVDSGASTPGGPVGVPFADRGDADAFAEETGGTVLSWTEFTDRPVELDDASVVREGVDDKRAAADARVAADRPLLDREVTAELDPGDSIQAAIDGAPNGSGIRLAPGRYEGPVEIDRSITLHGPGATIAGNGTGSPVRVTTDDVGIVGPTITGIGNQTRDESAVTGDEWDANIELGYGHGDAAIAAVGAPGVHVADVTVPSTPANGVLLRDSPETVVRNLSVTGPPRWNDGFMGVMAMRSSVVVEDSTFRAGRDGIYLHRSPETVIRNNTFRANRYGVHLMHTSDAVVAENRFADQEFGGITIMTDPARNAIVGNVVANTSNAISTSGSDSYIARNIAVDSRIGITTSAVGSLYEHNVVRNNTYGMRTGSVLVTSRVWKNDFVDNEHHAGASAGPLRVWAHNGHGNYWQGAYGEATGDTYDRAYVPTDSVDGQLHRSPARRTVAESPVKKGLRALRGSAPGLRSGSVIDPDPQTDPQNPALLRRSSTVVTHGIDALSTNDTTAMTATADPSAGRSEAQP